jgi:hypothetical protein
MSAAKPPLPTEFRRLLAADRKVERKLFWGELANLILIVILILWRLQFGA